MHFFAESKIEPAQHPRINIEKPTLEYARKHLRVAGMKEDEFLGVFGMYVLEPTIFELLAGEINNNERFKGDLGI